jgi:hypothetical protein
MYYLKEIQMRRFRKCHEESKKRKSERVREMRERARERERIEKGEKKIATQ